MGGIEFQGFFCLCLVTSYHPLKPLYHKSLEFDKCDCNHKDTTVKAKWCNQCTSDPFRATVWT